MDSKAFPVQAATAAEVGMDREFLLAVFHETNEHMRNTEQKYLIVTAAYLGLSSVITSTVAGSIGSASVPTTIAHAVLLLVGSMVYVMQGWYRSWKLHYLDVCLKFRFYFLGNVEDEKILPYWLRPDLKSGRASIDNLLRALTLVINLGLALLIASELHAISHGVPRIVGFSVGALFIGSYLLLLFAIARMIHPSNPLNP